MDQTAARDCSKKTPTPQLTQAPTWACAICTFENQPATKVCEMCQTAPVSADKEPGAGARHATCTTHATCATRTKPELSADATSFFPKEEERTTPLAPKWARTDDGDRVVVTIQSATEEFSIAMPADAKIIGLKSAISDSKGHRADYQQLFVKDSEEPLADFVKFSDLFGGEEERKLFLVLEQESEGDANMCVPSSI